VSDNLSVIDCETHETFEGTIRAIEAEGVNTWLVETARGGHVYFRTAEPLGSAKTANSLIELRGERQYVLAPPSVHPTGKSYDFLNLTTEIAHVELAQLAFLGIDLKPARPGPRIPASTLQLLRAREPGYSTRSEQEQAIVVGLVNIGFEFERILSLFRYFPAAGKFLEKNKHDPEEARRWLARGYHKARQLGDSGVVKRIKAMIAAVALRPWTGRTAITDKRVLLAHLGIARRIGSITYEASTRELAEIALVKRQTAARANRRLVQSGFLLPISPPNAVHARRFSLKQNLLIGDHSMGNTQREGVVPSYLLEVPEALGGRLGRSAPDIFRLLIIAGPLTVSEIVERSGRCMTTVRKALKAMMEIIDYGSGEVLALIEMEDKKYKIVEEADLKAVARVLGTEGKRSRMRIDHERERLLHRLRLNGRLP